MFDVDTMSRGTEARGNSMSCGIGISMVMGL